MPKERSFNFFWRFCSLYGKRDCISYLQMAAGQLWELDRVESVAVRSHM